MPALDLQKNRSTNSHAWIEEPFPTDRVRGMESLTPAVYPLMIPSGSNRPNLMLTQKGLN